MIFLFYAGGRGGAGVIFNDRQFVNPISISRQEVGSRICQFKKNITVTSAAPRKSFIRQQNCFMRKPVKIVRYPVNTSCWNKVARAVARIHIVLRVILATVKMRKGCEWQLANTTNSQVLTLQVYLLVALRLKSVALTPNVGFATFALHGLSRVRIYHATSTGAGALT